MNKQVLSIITGVALAACGEKAQEAKTAMNAMRQVAEASAKIEDSQNEAEKFATERQERGDTLAMSYAELQKFLPSAPNDYATAGEPGGSSQNMPGYSMSQAEQTYTRPADADGNTPTIHVTLVDFGGTQAAYGMMAVPMMMNLSQEDAHRRMQTLKIDVPYTWASEEYDKDNKVAKVTAVTRYRYMITVEAGNQSTDQSAMVKSLAEEIAKKFEGK